MGSGGGGGDSETTVRYAPYIEEHHSNFLDDIQTYVDLLKDDSPYDGYVDLDIGPAFFGTGYTLASFPSLYDMFGKFMAGLDVDTLFDQVLDDTLNGNAVSNVIAAEAVSLSDDLEETAIPRFTTGMRDINSVLSSTFIVGKAMMETARTKALSKFSAEIRYRLIPAAIQRWESHLKWNEAVVRVYIDMLKLYIVGKIDTDKHNYSIATKDALWPFTVLDFQRAALGALQGATSSKKTAGEDDSVGSAIGGAMAGASAGYMISEGNPLGAAIGGALGFAASLF